jgi:hypothetical protein
LPAFFFALRCKSIRPASRRSGVLDRETIGPAKRRMRLEDQSCLQRRSNDIQIPHRFFSSGCAPTLHPVRGRRQTGIHKTLSSSFLAVPSNIARP